MRFVRGFLWRAGAPARSILIGAISVYRVTLSGWVGGQCRFHPTCSRYAEEAIRSHGALKGSILAAGRVLRCNPFGRGGLDPVPRPHADSRAPVQPLVHEAAYDVAIQRAIGEPDAG